MPKPDKRTYQQGYAAGYQTGRKGHTVNITPEMEESIALNWLLKHRTSLAKRVSEIDRELKCLAAEEQLRSMGFEFPAGFLSSESK